MSPETLTARDLAEIVLWSFLIAQGAAVLYILRRVERFLTPAAAGPPLGLALPRRVYDGAFPGRVDVGGDRDRPSILLFTSLYCEKCKANEPFMLAFCRANTSRFDVVLIGTGPLDETRAYAQQLPLSQSGVSLAVLETLEQRERDFGVRVAPFMLILDRRGVIVAKGRAIWEGEFRDIAAASGLNPEIPSRPVRTRTAYHD
jgi:hypothetical protein